MRTMTITSRHPRILLKVNLALVSALLAFGVCDTALRIAANIQAKRQGPSVWTKLYVHDSKTGTLWHRTNASAVVSWRSTPPHTVSFNNLGCRGTSPVIDQKPPGTIRILTLGGSTTESVFVADGETWPEKLQQRLNSAPGFPPVEVINLGCLGYSIKSSVTNLIVRGLSLEPDVVIVYHRINDFLLGYPHRNSRIQVHHAFVDYEKRPAGVSRVLCNSIIIDRLCRKGYYRNGRSSAEFVRAYWRSEDKVAFDPTGVQMPIVAGLESLLALSKQHQFQLVVGIQATLMKPKPLEMELPRLWEVLRWTYDGRFVKWSTMLDAMARIRDAQVEFCQEHDLLCVDVERSVPKTTEFFIDHVHCTPRGTDKVADAFAQAILQAEGLLQSTPGQQDAAHIFQQPRAVPENGER